MLKPGFAHEPLSGSGAGMFGGRFNRKGRAALYLSADPQTAYAEYTGRNLSRFNLILPAFGEGDRLLVVEGRPDRALTPVEPPLHHA